MVSMPLSVLFIGLLLFAIYTYRDYSTGESEATKKFLGDYKLNRLDRKDCQNCTVRLNRDYQYDIIVDNEVMGHGKWSIESAVDIPGPFLRLENGPQSVIWEHDRVIPYIDRTGR